MHCKSLSLSSHCKGDSVINEKINDFEVIKLMLPLTVYVALGLMAPNFRFHICEMGIIIPSGIMTIIKNNQTKHVYFSKLS